MILREAAQQALEVLHEIDSPMLVKEIAKVGKAITALRAALAKSEQDPLMFAGMEIKEIRVPDNNSMRFDGDVLVIDQAMVYGVTNE